MRDIQGMSYAEIEQILDLSQSQVKVYLHRGRRQLRSNQSLRNAAIEQTIIREEPSEVKQDSVLAIHRNHEEGTGHVK